jgi:hypothetical protein
VLIVPELGLDNPLILECPDDTTADRRDDKRVYVSLAGHYSLASSINARGEPRQFACRAVNISAYGVALAAPVTGKIGMPATANIEQLGRIKGAIIRVFKRGFSMSIAASDAERRILAAKIDWIERNRHFEIPDNRAHARFIPRRPLSLLTLADGSVLPCFVIDISVSGAAISADVAPRVGTVLAVGKVAGRVARYLAGGFAVEFIETQDRQEIESLVIPG